MNNDTPAPPSPVAILDVGTNAVRFSVHAWNGETWERQSKDHAFAQLGRPHDGQTTLHPNGVAETMAALDRFCRKMRAPDLQVAGVVAVATEAVRRASDGDAFVARVKKELGLDLTIIDGQTEARLGAEGVMLLDPHSHSIVADLGGGSLQLTRISDGEIITSASLPLGVQRLQTIRQDSLAATLRTELEQLPPDLRATSHLYVIGGSLRDLAKLYRARAGDPGDHDIHGMRLDPEKIRGMNKWMATPEAIPEMTSENTYGIKRERARFLPLAGTLLATLTEFVDAAHITVSSAGIRDGLLQEIAHSSRTVAPVPQAKVGLAATPARPPGL